MIGPSLGERDRRWSNIRRELENQGLEALLVVSDGHLERRGSLRYVSDVNGMLRYGYVVFPVKGEPVGIYNKGGWIEDRRPLPFRGGWVVESEPYVSFIADVARELGVEKGRIGIEGDFVPAPVYEGLVKELPDATFGHSDIIHRLKMVKSPDELRIIESGAEMVDKAFAECLEFARPGMTWNDVTCEVYRLLYQAGSEDIGGYPLSRSNAAMGQGDIYNHYPEPQAPGGYWMQFGRLFSLGEPDKKWQTAWELDMKVLEKGAEVLRPGNTGADVMRAINESLKGTPYTGADRGSGHGAGLDIIERPFIALDDETILEPGMVVAIHPVLAPPPDVFEACADLFVVTEGKPRKLSKVTPELKVL
jgi:Xaa-Pro aminopeptidase